MEAIRCRYCFSPNVKKIDEDTYQCLSCDNKFKISSLSKEFRKTDEHIGRVHEDVKETHEDVREVREDVKELKEAVNSISGIPSMEELSKTAKNTLKTKDYDDAHDIYKKMTQNYPDNFEGWYGIVLADTYEFTDVKIWYDEIDEIVKCRDMMMECSDRDESLIEEMDLYFTDYIRNVLESSIEDEQEFINENNRLIEETEGELHGLARTYNAALSSNKAITKKRGTVNIAFYCCLIAPVLILAGITVGALNATASASAVFNLVFAVIADIVGIKIILRIAKSKESGRGLYGMIRDSMLRGTDAQVRRNNEIIEKYSGQCQELNMTIQELREENNKWSAYISDMQCDLGKLDDTDIYEDLIDWIGCDPEEDADENE